MTMSKFKSWQDERLTPDPACDELSLPPEPLLEDEIVRRFWLRIFDVPNGNLSTPCWAFPPAFPHDRHGRVRDTNMRVIPAHVFAYQTTVGQVPSGLVLDHLCLNKWCVNPMHLEPVTAQENTRRHYRKLERDKRRLGKRLSEIDAEKAELEVLALAALARVRSAALDALNEKDVDSGATFG